MTAPAQSTLAVADSRASLIDIGAIAICALVWGTTWFAITLQLGVVDPVGSVVYRFTLAAVLILGWVKLRGNAIALTPAQHRAAFGVGFFTFSLNYTFVYWAEERVTSAVVAVVFASMAFVNLIVFRVAFGKRAAFASWVAACLGVAGVALLSWGELSATALDPRTLFGLGLTFAAVVAAAVSNLFAHKGEEANTPLLASTGWAMLYGAGVLALFALATGRTWRLPLTTAYIGSLLYLAVLGSVVAFLVYYALARRRGYGLASYVSALTPPTAMLMSSLFEHKHWGWEALGGVALVIAGQGLLLTTRKS